MKTKRVLFAAVMIILMNLTSCIVEEHHYGHGYHHGYGHYHHHGHYR